MRIFNELVTNDWIDDNTFRSIEFYWEPALGAIDTMRFFVVADKVTGASPSLNVSLYEGPDITKRNGMATLVSSTLTAGTANTFTASLLDTTPGSYALSLGWWLTGGTAHLRIWVTGRGKA